MWVSAAYEFAYIVCISSSSVSSILYWSWNMTTYVTIFMIIIVIIHIRAVACFHVLSFLHFKMEKN